MTRAMLLTSLCAFLAAVLLFGLSLVALDARSASLCGDGSCRIWLPWSARDIPVDNTPASRDLAWTGGDTLRIAVPADVQFTQGPVASIRVTGPKYVVDRVTVRDGGLVYDQDLSRTEKPFQPMQVVMTAPGVKHFKIAGHKTLTVNGYDQDEFGASIAGSGRITVHGKAQTATLHIAGSGDIDAADLPTREANVHIAGSGDAAIAPSDRAVVSIAGSGDVTLKTKPAAISRHVAGSGRIIEAP
jgi:hypothetical protein